MQGFPVRAYLIGRGRAVCPLTNSGTHAQPVASVKRTNVWRTKTKPAPGASATNNRLHSVAPVVQIGAVSAAKCMAAPRCWRGPTKTTARVYDGMTDGATK